MYFFACFFICVLALSNLPGPSSAGWAGREFALSFMQNYEPSSNHRLQLLITAVQANAKVTVQVPTLKFNQVKSLNAGLALTCMVRDKVSMVVVQAGQKVKLSCHRQLSADPSADRGGGLFYCSPCMLMEELGAPRKESYRQNFTCCKYV